MLDHEPQILPPLGIDQPSNEALAENFQPQCSSHLTNMDVQQPSISPSWSLLDSIDSHELDPLIHSSTLSPQCVRPWSTQSTSPPGNDLTSEDCSDGKRELSSSWRTFACPTCKENFANESLYRRHTRHRDCISPPSTSACNACGRVFKLSKDLRRHQGHRGSATSCPAVKGQSQQLKQFACTCEKRSYTRKDSLQRHMNCENARENSQLHKCKICRYCRCRCQASIPNSISS